MAPHTSTVAALVLLTVWFVLTLGVRIGLQLRRTGDSGVRLDLGRPFTTEWWAGIGVVVSLVVLVAAVALELAELDGPLIDPLAALTSAAVQWTGLVVTVVGIVVTFVAQLAMGASWRIGVDAAETTDLVASGPFRWVRNPIFTAMGITVIGLVLLVPSVLAVVSVGLLVVALELQVRRVEEPYLRATHGESYRRYTSQVGRFVPGVGRTA